MTSQLVVLLSPEISADILTLTPYSVRDSGAFGIPVEERAQRIMKTNIVAV